MFWYRLSRIDRMIFVASAMGLLLTLVLIFEDRWIYKLLSGSDESREKIGVVKMASNDVRRRHESEFSWLPLDSKTEVYQGDNIFTGERSEAIIITERGEQIQISPNSLVVINAQTDSIRLDINFGSVSGQVGKDKKLLIASGGDVTEFKGDDAVVKVDVGSDKNLVVNVLEGQVEVTSDSGRRVLGPKDQAEISEAGTVSLPDDVKIELLSPLPDRILKPDEARELAFTWKSSYQFPNYNIEISSDPDFKSVLLKEKINRTVYRPPSLPTNQRLYWRITGQLKTNQSPAKSATATFVLAEDRPPLVLFPKDRQRYTFEEQPLADGRSVNMAVRWKPQAIANKWEVHLAQSPDFTKDLRILESKTDSLELSDLGEGNYYLKVRTQDWNDASWSETITFLISKKASASLKPPQVVTSDETFYLSTKFEGRNYRELATVSVDKIAENVESIPELAWNTIPGATNYEIQIASNRDFSRVVVQETVADTRYGWTSVRPGQFYWRIRSIGTNNQRGQFTKAQVLNVYIAAPKSLTDEEIVEEVTSISQMDSAPPPFLLKWSPTLLTAQYQIEFDKTPDLKKPLRITAPYPFKKIQAPTAGVYYWRVRSLNAVGQAMTEWSKVHKYDYKRAYLSPETTKELRALYPNNETLMLIGKGDLKINFRWATPIKNGRYRFQMSTDKEFKTTMLNFVTENDQFLYQKPLNDGWYYWRLRVETPQFTSPWTTSYQFQVQSEFSPFNFEKSEREQEKQLKKYEQKRAMEESEYAKQRTIAAQSEAAEIDAKKPQLESPTDLYSPDKFVLELRNLNSNGQALETWPLTKQYSLLKDTPYLEWRASVDASEYRIEFAKDETFSAILEIHKSNRPSFRWVTPKPGVYYWRVQAFGRNHRPSAFSSAQKMEVLVPSPQARTPHAVVANADAVGIQANFQWNSTPFTRAYEVEWDTTPNFSSAKKQRTTTGQFSFRTTRAGQYYWRVKALDEKMVTISEFSKPRPIFLAALDRSPSSVKSPQILFPMDGFSLSTNEGEDALIEVNWAGPAIAVTYLVEVSRDADFSEVYFKKSTAQKSLQIEVPAGSAVAFWRLSALQGNKPVWTSEIRKINLSPISSGTESAGQQNVPAKRLPARSN